MRVPLEAAKKIHGKKIHGTPRSCKKREGTPSRCKKIRVPPRSCKKKMRVPLEAAKKERVLPRLLSNTAFCWKKSLCCIGEYPHIFLQVRGGVPSYYFASHRTEPIRAWSYPVRTRSSWIHLIRLIKWIWHKIGKPRISYNGWKIAIFVGKL